MGVCLPKDNNNYIKSAYDKNSIGKSSLSRYSTNFTALRSFKSDIRLSKITKYDDINKYYKLSEKISSGGSGIIYGGYNINSTKKSYDYAIKQVIKQNDQLNISLIKEIEINSIINHNNIVHCFDIFEDDLSVYFVFEFMPDGDLFDYILKKHNHRLKEKEIINILEQILLALIYLHEKVKVIHRDIKPENFIIKKEKNEIITVKLMDFGNSDFIKEEGFNYIAQGTPLYMAPEIYLEQPYDSKIDMWATGVVLYNMVTGSHPFKHNNNNNNKEDYLENYSKSKDVDLSYMDEDKIIMNNVLNKQLDFNVFTNYGLRSIAQRLLEPDPKQRYSAMEAFDELNRVKRGINNRVISNAINESPQKLIKNPIMYEDLNGKKKLAKSSFHNRFKGIFKNINPTRIDFNKNGEDDDISEEKEKDHGINNNNNKKNNNEIRIKIKKNKNK